MLISSAGVTVLTYSRYVPNSCSFVSIEIPTVTIIITNSIREMYDEIIVHNFYRNDSGFQTVTSTAIMKDNAP